jgi:hypothetical protein
VFIEPCDLFVFSTSPSGRADSADWIRTVSVSTMIWRQASHPQ